ncbi:MAG TPA: hypothetical protein VNZ45_01155, partial [Bacteroidia bacterium]|nr:hypothetical protein [Bacteroidia bacterium]
MIYLTYNDSPDGVYQSQVIDVCHYWEDTFKERVRLIAFISLRDYFVNKEKIKFAYPDAKVLPMFPGIDNWMLNSFRLNLVMLFRKRQKVIARGVFATLLALKCKRFEKVCFDARGAYEAEWSEYLKSFSPTLAAKMKDLEKQAIQEPDFRLAVSNQLIEYWKEQYGYSGSDHVVIPCALPTELNISYNASTAAIIRANLNISNDDVLLVYSGSSAQWQSFSKLEEYISTAFSQNAHLKLLMLCKPGGESVLAK